MKFESPTSKEVENAESDESNAAPSLEVVEGLPGRASKLRQRYLRARADIETSVNDDDSNSKLLALLDLAVPSFADWCAIDIVDEDGLLRRLAVRHRECDSPTTGADHARCCPPALLARAGGLNALVDRVLSNGQSEAWPAPGKPALPWAVVVGLFVKNQPFAAVTFVTDVGSPGYGAFEVAVAEEVAWGVAGAIERVVLREDARDAVRGTQRIASQLHQLIAVSITVAGLHGEHEILTNLASSTRRVFNADLAVVSLESGPVAPLLGVARRGTSAASLGFDNGKEPEEFPRSRAGTTAPWREGDWLVAPLLERRDSARGVIAIRRSDRDFGPEDEEVLTLLAQMASTALAASELSRSIRRSEARWRVLVESAPVGIVEVDLEGRVRWWNLTAGKIFDWPPYDEPNRVGEPGFPSSAAGALTSLWNDALNGVATSDRDFLEVEIKGRRRELATSAALLSSGLGEARSVLTLVDDVTDYRELQAEVRHAQQMELRGQVASSIAHDFNNLLTLISGYAEILAKDLAADARSIEMVKDIQATASRASLLTAQLQTIGRTRSLEPVVLSPVAVLQSNAEVLERILGVEIELQLTFIPRPGNVRVDAGQFEQMILNLAINARDAMAEGGELMITVDGRAVDHDQSVELNVAEGDYVVILVSDTGIGMDEATRQRCFEPFFTTKGPFKGTGMGLAAARRLVEQSGGAIACRSGPGEGTTFEILLPAVPGVEAEGVLPTEAATPRGSATVLLAEDDDVLRQLMKQVLGRNGYQILEAEDGERAIELASEFEGTIDLLVSDVVMPHVTGPELAATLQASNPGLRVLLTSGTADATVLQELRPGTSAFLAKPFRPSQLIDQVHELLARR